MLIAHCNIGILRFMLDEMTVRRLKICHIFGMPKNSKIFFISCYFSKFPEFFFDLDQGIHLFWEDKAT